MTDEEVETEAQKTLRVIKTLLAVTSFLLTILFVIVIVLEIQVWSRNADIHRVREVQEETKIVVDKAASSSARAEKAINDAIAQSRNTSGANSTFAQQIRDGLESIKRIEAYINQLKGQ